LSLLVLDANVALAAASSRDGFALFGEDQLIAPPLLWPEARSALHVALARGLVGRETAEQALQMVESGVVEERRHRHLGRETWQIADELGWAKTYDAEYLALARLLDVAVATLDTRMTRAAERLGIPSDQRIL
jgi:predicted nucleic acid-binding protein